MINDSRARKMCIHSHRGGFSPDNTLKAFGLAIEHNYEAIELDVRYNQNN
jgi:glycerophosphoryl diester phosphodiesterase